MWGLLLWAFRQLARLKGFEPLTRSLEGCRSIHLSYRRTGAGYGEHGKIPRMKAIVFVLMILAAAEAATATPAAAPAAPPPAEALARLFEDYFEARLALDPFLATSIGDTRYNDRLPMSLSKEDRAKEEALHRDVLARLATIDRAALGEPDRLSYDVFRTARERDVEGQRFPEWLLPVRQNGGMPIVLAQIGSGKGLHPFRTVKDYDDFLKRIDAYGVWVDQAMANMREGARSGHVQPKVLMEKTLPVLAAHIVSKPEESIFWGAVAAMPVDFSTADKERLTAAYRVAITEKVVPAYRRLRDFVRDEYLPKCRDSVGLDALPGGKEWYAYRVRSLTTTRLTPAEIHDLGLAEVKRIHQDIQGLMRRLEFKGDLAAFFAHTKSDPRFFWSTAEELIAGYGDIKKTVDARLPRLFESLPKADYEVRAVEPFRERSASGGQYQAADADGTRPGIFFANTYDLKSRPKWAMTALSLHEGNPGHHFQITLAREGADLPRFRRFGGFTAYTEGWGLYAESLGSEIGVYDDPYAYFGRLEGELFRAIRLVVDTGLHSKGWTRDQVITYMGENSAAGEATRVSETERYIAMPAQALAYKIGELKIREMRTRAERRLGPKFDVRKFHTQVLKDGALPLDLLEAKIDAWIQSQS